MTTSVRRRAVALAVGLVALSACSTSQLQFTADKRFEFQTPEARSLVQVPLTVSWTMKDFDASLTGDGAFVVFVDRAPMQVGKAVRSIVPASSGCASDARCPSAEDLAALGVYVTTQTSVQIPVLPAQATGTGDEQHTVAVVLIDKNGMRTTESAWHEDFRLKRRRA